MTKRINIFDTISNDAGSRIRAYEWYMKKIEEMRGRGLVTKGKLVTYSEMATSKIEIGSVYMFIYDNPKYKDTLKYFDAFPIVIPFGFDNQHFTGYNLHYQPPRTRWLLLKKLMTNSEISTVRRSSKEAKMQMDYQLLKGASSFKDLQPTIHQYLYERVGQINGGLFLKIPPAEWPIACLLPVQDFRSKDRSYSAERVWQDSMNRR